MDISKCCVFSLCTIEAAKQDEVLKGIEEDAHYVKAILYIEVSVQKG